MNDREEQMEGYDMARVSQAEQSGFSRLNVGAGPLQPTPTRPSEIHEQLGMQEKGLSLLHEIISALENRVSAVSVPRPASTGNGGGASTPAPACATGVGTLLAQSNAVLSAAIQRLQSIQAGIAL